MDYIRWLRSKIGHRKTILTYATALIRDDAGRLLFQRRTDFSWWGLPGGVVELGETFAECARREAFEETGFQVEPTRLLGVFAAPEWDVSYPNGDAVQQFTVALECRITGGSSRPDGTETTESRFFDPASPPETPAWYAAMIAALSLNTPHFDAPVLGTPKNSWYYSLRETVGTARILAPGANAVIFDDRNRVLLGLRSDNNKWGLPAGFMELGETPAGTAVREAREELAIEIRPTQLIGVFTGPDYFHTYPDGNEVQIVSASFRAEWTGGEIKPDGDETLEAAWFALDALPVNIVERNRKMIELAAKHPDGGRFQ